MCTSPTLSRSSALEHFEQSNWIEWFLPGTATVFETPGWLNVLGPVTIEYISSVGEQCFIIRSCLQVVIPWFPPNGADCTLQVFHHAMRVLPHYSSHILLYDFVEENKDFRWLSPWLCEWVISDRVDTFQSPKQWALSACFIGSEWKMPTISSYCPKCANNVDVNSALACQQCLILFNWYSWSLAAEAQLCLHGDKVLIGIKQLCNAI